MKALCSERYEDWSGRFNALGLKCLELTGDSVMYDYSELQDVHIILTTPVSHGIQPVSQLPFYMRNFLPATVWRVVFCFTNVASSRTDFVDFSERIFTKLYSDCAISNIQSVS